MPPMTRREFAGAAMGALAAGCATTGPQPKPASKPATTRPVPSERIRIGMIGCGSMGMGDLRLFLDQPEVDCPIVCDVDEARLEQAVALAESARGTKPDAVKDFRRVIDRADVDACVIATPDHWHALPTIYACELGKDVYVQKPLAKSIEEGRVMRDAVRRYNRVVQMGTQWRSGEHYRDAIEFVHSGQLGTIRMVRAWGYLDWVTSIGNPPNGEPPEGVDYDMWLGPAPKRPFNPNRFHFNFRWFWDYANGLQTDWGVHLLNICLWGMGYEYPHRVTSYGGIRVLDDNRETPDTQVSIYDFPSYTLLFEHQTGGGLGPGGKPAGMLFNGSEGSVHIDTQGWEVIPEPKKDTLEPRAEKAVSDGRPAHFRNFLDCIKTRNQPVENLDTGHLVTTVAQLGNISYLTGEQVTWDAETEQIIGSTRAQELLACAYRSPWQLPKV